MKRDRKADVGTIAIFALVAALATVGPFTHMAAFRFLATFAGILLGPGGLACRLATRSSWIESLTIGIAINVAIVMLLGLFLVSVNFWHPIMCEILVPLTTFVLCGVLLRKEMGSASARHGGSSASVEAEGRRAAG
jgi:uncharacterized membrane protein